MSDTTYMARALELAERGRYSVSPNPMVGCIVVRDGNVIAEGWHERAGKGHAEVNAIAAATADLRGGTMYVTLEPCSHHGRTPPCADAVVASGVARVVVAASDPDPRVSGQGIARLREAGIEVVTGVLEAEARRLNEKFLHSVASGTPFVLLKAGMTLDGKLATVARESRWITSEEARERSLALREEYDAILVGGGTVGTDDPSLTRRLGTNGSIVPWTRVIVDGSGDIPRTSAVLTDGGRTILFTSFPQNYRATDGLEIRAAEAKDGRIDLEWVLRELDRAGLRSVIVEGGAQLHSDFIRRALWQKLALFVAPMIVGGGDAPSIFSGEGVARLTEAYRFRFDRAEPIGRDLLITAYPLEQRGG